LSRGATLHHFPSKMDIIRAAVDYLHEKRLQAFRNSIKEILFPAQLAYDREWYQTAWDLFPEWHSDRRSFDLALNLCQQLIDGMVIGEFTHAHQIDKKQLLDYLEEKVRELQPTN